MSGRIKSAVYLRYMCHVAIFASICGGVALGSYGADSAVQVQLDASKSSPRAVESLTERGILRDYRFAWTSMAQALELSTLDPLEGPFAGEAKKLLSDTVVSQQHSRRSLGDSAIASGTTVLGRAVLVVDPRADAGAPTVAFPTAS